MKTSVIFMLLIALHIVNDNQPPEAYLFSKQIEKKLENDTSSNAFIKASWEFSFIQEYKKAAWAYDQIPTNYPGLTDEQKSYFLAYKPINAIKWLIEKADNEQVIIINEAHHQPLHRTFTTSLLEGLYEKGYRFLGLEALSYFDSLLNQRGYPIIETGFYTQEPQFGNLIREALQLGYEFFPYETTIQADGKEREIQ